MRERNSNNIESKSKNKETREIKLKITKDGILALLISTSIVFLIWLKLKNLINNINTFSITCVILIITILTIIFWKRIKYFYKQKRIFIFDMAIVWFLSFIISWTFFNSYWPQIKECVNYYSFLHWYIKFCSSHNDFNLITNFLLFSLTVFMIRFFFLILLLPECNDTKSR